MAASAAFSSTSVPAATSPPQLPSPSVPRHSHSTHPLLPFLLRSKTILHLKEIHARAIRSVIKSTVPSPPESFLYGRILHHASASNHLDYAVALLCNHRHFLLDTPPSSFLWNTLIATHSRAPEDDSKRRALDLYVEMLLDGRVPPDKYTFPFVLKVCAYLSLLPEGAQLHAHLTKLGFSLDLYVTNSLLHFYASCGKLETARGLFDKMPSKSLVSWNVIIDGCVACGEHDAALELFRRLQKETEFNPDGYTLQSVLEACAGLGSLSLGMWAHAFALKRVCGWDSNFELLINNALLDMYCKGGSVELAKQLFERMPQRDTASWNSLIMGFATNGMAEDAFGAFRHMSEARDQPKPNSVTFLAVLSACNHGGGLVLEGRRYFSMMVDDYGIEPQIEHYGCTVDLLARAGRIDDALEVVSSMPCRPDAVIWRSLLDACSKRNVAVDVCESVAKRALEESSPDDAATTSGAYVLLSRIYASADRWDDVGLVRRLMEEEGVRKEPGCSCIEIDGFVHEFLAADTSHPDTTDIYCTLDVIDEVLSSVGYISDLSQAPMVVDEEEGDQEKRRALRLHSERLAVAFGLMHLKKTGASDQPIRVLKNLRMCRDCHGMMKVVSSAFGVEIIVRDRIRFHRFKDGLCSCSDYW